MSSMLVAIGVHNLPYCSFDFCAIVLNVIVLVNFIINKKIRNTIAKLFYAIAFCSLLASVFNLLAILQSVFYIPPVLCNVFQLAYSFFYNLAGLVFLIYTINLIYENARFLTRFRVIVWSFCIFIGAGFVLNVLCNFKVPGISRGMYCAVLYGGQILIGLNTLIIVFLNKQKLRLTQRINIYLFIVILTFANLWQILIAFGLFGNEQLASFALSVAVLLVYAILQRPEDELDHISGMFNIHTHMLRTNERLRSGKPFLALVFELSNMAIVNTTFGIKGGNQVLQEMATRVREVLPKHLLLFRLNGSRFAINFNNEAEYKEFEPKFKAALEMPVEMNGTKIRIASMGCLVAMPEITDKVSDLEEILKYYRSVATNFDQIVVADKEAVERSSRRARVKYAIQNALKNGTFQVYYQPIYCVATKRISSCEALIRLKDPELGFIGPDEFIPIAEESGKIVDVGRFVMKEVCRFIKEERPQDLGISFIDVNLSVIQCMHPEIIEDINDILTEYEVPRNMVNLEVTETASAKSYALLQARLKELHRSGFTISLDDFGSGFSSVEYLINFPFDIVKLDKSLVWAYMSTEKYEPILKHYMPMLHSLGLKIVAEGVETEEMLHALEELGCDYIQGYYFSRPIPKEQFMEYVKNASKGVMTA